MSVDFSHIREQYTPGSQSVPYSMTRLRGDVVLDVKHAGESNRPYYNEVNRKNAKTSAITRILRGKEDPATAKAALDEARELFAKFVVVGWRGVVDRARKPVEFSVENCREFLFQLPDYIFRELMTFCSNQSNFLPDAIDNEEAQEQAGN